jgi:hypothetical protein
MFAVEPTRMSVTEGTTAFFACPGKKVQFAMSGPRLRGICRATGLLENHHRRVDG